MVGIEGQTNPLRWRTLLVAALTVCLVLSGPAPARADIAKSDFPRAAQVKASMKGSGTWMRSLGDPNAVAARATPAGCRSDLPFTGATEHRNAFYMGSIPRKRKYFGVAEVTVYRFPSPAAASQSLADLPEFLDDCAKSVEWWCEDCDGIATIYRTSTSPRRVGAQSVTWNQRSVGMGITNGHAIAARTGATVVVTVASHQTNPENKETPPRPTWKRTVSVAKKALARAGA